MLLSRFFKLIFSSALLAPAILVLAYVVFIFVVRGSMPSADEIVNTFSSLYAKYGYEIIFVAALLESLILVNIFVPGMIAMAMGAIFAKTGQTDLVLVIITASTGLLLGYMIDFLLGYFGFGDMVKKLGYGWIVEKARKQLKKFGSRSLILGFIYPNVGSVLSFSAGASGYNFPSFIILAFLSTLFWVPLWGIVIYAMGEVFITILTKYSILVISMVIAGIILVRFLKEGKFNVRS